MPSVDAADIADVRAQNWLDGSLARATGRRQGFPSLNCVDCGGDIPPQRLVAQWDAERCLLCQAEWDHRMRMNSYLSGA